MSPELRQALIMLLLELVREYERRAQEVRMLLQALQAPPNEPETPE